MRRVLLPAISAALVAAACSGDTADTSSAATTLGSTSSVPSTSSTGPPDATTSTTVPEGPDFAGFEAAARDGIEADLTASRESGGGFLETQEVLDLFAAAYGPIPGGDPDRFEVRPSDGSLILRNMLRISDGLDPDQQAAFRAAVGPASGAEASTAGEGSAVAAVHRPGLTGAGPTEVAALAAAQSDVIAGLVGSPLGLRLDVRVTAAVGDVRGDALPFGGGEPDSIPYDSCQVRISPGLAGDELLNTVTHEVFHCFQFTFSTGWPSTPDWVMEGQAEWVGARAGVPDSGTAANFDSWVTYAGESLFSKDYDALGLYWEMEQSGVDVWAAMPAMIGKGNQDAAAVMGAPASIVMWMGTTDGRYERSPTLPVEANWRIDAGDAPFPPGRRSEWFTVREDDPFEESRTLKAFSRFGVWQFELEDELAFLTFRADAGGFEFVEEGGFKPFGGPFTGRFCIREGGCECEAEEEFEQGSDRLLVGVGSVGGGEATVKVETQELRGFADGSWTGELIATPIRTDTAGAILRGNPIGAPFTFVVTEGEVTGAYSTSMEQDLDAGPDLQGEGVGTVTGAATGCWYSPNLVAAEFTFNGTVTIDGETVPFDFTQPFPADAGPVGFARWRFDESTDEDQASGTLETAPFLDFMRSVGVGVNSVEIRFVATRTG